MRATPAPSFPGRPTRPGLPTTAPTPPPAGPTPADLAAIEVEWPLIAAELDLVEEEIHVLTVEGGPSALDWRRLRRAERRVARELLARLSTRTTRRPTPAA